MKRFADLYAALDATTRTSAKTAALARFFEGAPDDECAWAVRVLSGKALIRRVSGSLLRAWAAQAAGLPVWLVAECHDAVGDMSETISLLEKPRLPECEPSPDGDADSGDLSLADVIERYVLPLQSMDDDGRRAVVMDAWSRLDPRGTFLYHKLLGGALRVGVSKTLVVRAIAEVAGIEQAVMAQRMAGPFEPTAERYRALVSGDDSDAGARPYPFFLAHPLEAEPDDLQEAIGPESDWRAEWKWDGIRAQLVRRDDGASGTNGTTPVILWSRSEELLTAAFPEIAAAGEDLPPGTVLDGELLAWDAARRSVDGSSSGGPLPFGALQRRLNRKTYEPRLFDDVPVVYVAYDALEAGGDDLRERPLSERRVVLERLMSAVNTTGPNALLRLSDPVGFDRWAGLAELVATARDRGVEGVMLKHAGSPYGVGRTKAGETCWYKWKVDPYSIDAVLTLAQRGSGKRAGLFTDYTFAVWDRDADDEPGDGTRKLVTVAKAYSGLTNDEIEAVDRWIRNNTVSRYGPVSAVKPELVFELGFEGIQESTRHKAGYALRFPRMLRQRTDKAATDADSVASVAALFRRHAAGFE